MTMPRLTDRVALAQHRARAEESALFLHDEARADVEERLAMVNRSFTEPAIVAGLPTAWSDLVAGARIVPDAPVLDLDAGAHDLVVHALALHWADDPVGQLVQCRRALRPDGLLLAVTLGGQTLQELRRVLAETESRSRGGISPRVLPTGEIRDLGALLQRAGLALPVADNRTVTASYRDLRHLVADLRAMGETNALAGRDVRPLTRAELALTDAIYRDSFPAGDGRIRATFEFVFLTGWAPDASQPQPIRPGSAVRRLADALGTEERPAGDSAWPRDD